MLIMPTCLIFFVILCVTAYITSNVFAVLGVLALLLVILFFAVKKERFVYILLLFLFCVSLALNLKHQAVLMRLNSQTVTAEFTVIEEPYRTSSSQAVTIKANAKGLPPNTKLSFRYKGVALKMGGVYRADITLHSQDYNKAYYYGEGIYSSASLVSAPYFIKERPILIGLGNIRAYIKNCLYSNLSKSQAATLNAITVGEKSGFSEQFQTLVRRSGTSHIMVVSGMHFAIIMNAVFALAKRFTRSKMVRAVLALIGVVFISALCGFTMSILRAGLTYVIIALAPILKRDYDPVNTLCFAVILIMLFSPFAILSVSLQLSFLATLGILSFAPLITNEIKYRTKLPDKLIRFVISPLVMSLSATVMTLPVIIYNFGEISVVSPITNVLVSFAVTIALLSAAAGVLISTTPIISILHIPVFSIANIVTKYINTVISYFGSLSFATVKISSAWAIVAAFAVILLLLIINYAKQNLYYKHIKIFTKEKRDANNL